MTSPPERERHPGGRGAAESRGGRNRSQSTPPPPDVDYDDHAPELEGYTSDPLTADLWAAICMAADRGEFAEVAP